MIILTGLDCATFEFLLHDFEDYFNNYSQYLKDGMIAPVLKVGHLKGQPRLVMASDALGLVLVWTMTYCPTFVLKIIFGMTQTCVSVHLTFSIIIRISVLLEG